MERYVPYIIVIAVVVVVLVVFCVVYASRRKAAVTKGMTNFTKGNDGFPRAVLVDETLSDGNVAGERVYEVAGIDQQSDHPLGAVQAVIRGRIRFVLFGLILLAVALFGLWAIWIEKTDLGDLTSSSTNRVVATVLLSAAGIAGLWIMSFSIGRVKLRRTGFEIRSVFGSQSYRYRDVDFQLDSTWETRQDGLGYRPVLGSEKTQGHNRIWVCQILVLSGAQKNYCVEKQSLCAVAQENLGSDARVASRNQMTRFP